MYGLGQRLQHVVFGHAQFLVSLGAAVTILLPTVVTQRCCATIVTHQAGLATLTPQSLVDQLHHDGVHPQLLDEAGELG